MNAADALQSLVTRVAKRMAALGRDPWALAEGIDRTEGQRHDDVWHAVQLGRTFWTQTRRFAGTPNPGVSESSSVSGDFTPEQLDAIGSKVVSNDVARLRDVLCDLVTSNWRDLMLAALDGDPSVLNVNCLIGQHDQVWLCRASSGEGWCDIWFWAEGRGFVHAGIGDRIDGRIGNLLLNRTGNNWLVRFTQVDPAVLSFLPATARQYFVPSVKDHAALRKLSSMVQEAAMRAGAMTDLPLVLCSRDSRWHLRERSHESFSYRPPKIFWNGISTEPVRPGGRLRAPKTLKMVPCPDEILGLSAIIDSLEGTERPQQSEWRGLFRRAFGVPLLRGQMLALFVGPSHAVLVREQSVFEIGSDGLRFVGLCSLPDCSKPEVPISVQPVASDT